MLFLLGGRGGQTYDLPVNIIKLELYKPKVTSGFMQQTYAAIKDEKGETWSGLLMVFGANLQTKGLQIMQQSRNLYL